MNTFKLWLEPDDKIPQFKRLCWEIIEVSLMDVLRSGIHPWQAGDFNSLSNKFMQLVNKQEIKPKELSQFAYCQDMSTPVQSYYYARQTHFEQVLERIQKQVFFVDNLSYMELLGIAKQRLRDTWSHHVAHDILKRVHSGFDSMRRFLKSKDKKIKLSGYGDVPYYDLGKILSLDDFEGEDSIIITEVIGSASFRSTEFLDQVTDDKGRLRLIDSIRHFQLTVYGDSEIGYGSVVYNCHKNGDVIRFRPEIGTQPSVKELAKAIAEKWRMDDGKYCFETDIDQVEKILSEKAAISFSSMNYMCKSDAKRSVGKLAYSEIKGFSIGKHPSLNSSNETLKDYLRNRGMSMTGRKKELLDKLAVLCVDLYKANEPVLNDYFNEQKFMKVESLPKGSSREFPVLQDLDLRNMILTMYIIKHLRGNVILEASHNNETYDLLSLVQALINGEVSFNGCFLKLV